MIEDVGGGGGWSGGGGVPLKDGGGDILNITRVHSSVLKSLTMF